MIRIPCLLLLASLSWVVSSCTPAYYSVAEQVAGLHKRDILVSRVSKSKRAQEATKEQFADALEEFQSVVLVPGGDLETKYRKLKDAYDRSKSRADALQSRNDEVERVAKALFREWERELKDYSNPQLRTTSQAQLQDTRIRYQQLMSAMRFAESKVQPVLRTFHDQVLFLKHNLNARAIGSLQAELHSVEANMTTLIREMNVSIAEANRFIAAMQ